VEQHLVTLRQESFSLRIEERKRGYNALFIRSDNIILTGLVHGLVDYPLVGKNSQATLIILLAAIGCVEIARLAAKRKSNGTGYVKIQL
jgi:hypothetical protein